MSQGELFDILSKTGFPVVYAEWHSAPKLPYIVFYDAGSNNFGADNRVYSKATHYNIELYTKQKDIASQRKLEEVLDAHDLFYDCSGDVNLQSESMTEVIYFIEVERK
ncbi:MAG: hypothetical protein Q4A78_09920 [Peptostreptococcaceae bacterium]|nr:hypothetical protein [Peptostreptococcaceae bacterium]